MVNQNDLKEQTAQVRPRSVRTGDVVDVAQERVVLLLHVVHCSGGGGIRRLRSLRL